MNYMQTERSLNKLLLAVAVTEFGLVLAPFFILTSDAVIDFVN